MDELSAKYRGTTIIIGIQIATILALAAAAWFDIFHFEPSISASTVTILWVAIIFIAVGSFLLRRTFFNWEKFADTALLKGKTGVINQLRANALILASFAEAIAVLGFLIAALTGDSYQMLRAAAIAIIVCLINFPRRGIWAKIIESLEKLDYRR